MQTTLELNVSNDLVQAFGINALQKHLQKRLELLKMQLLADKITVGNDIKSEDIHHLIQKGGAFDFLEKEEEDIYSDKDLKIKY